VHIVGESSIGTGLRRIEALTGPDALRHFDHERALLAELAALLNVPPDQAPDRLRQRLDLLAETQRELDALRRAELDALAERLASRAEPVPSGWLVAERVDDATPADLRTLASAIAASGDGRGLAVLGTASGGKAQLVAATGPRSGVRARDLLTDAAREVGGGAGGKGALANAGGRRPENLTRAIAIAAAHARTL
jgi:alanyl-tRNA synthetase